MADSFENIPFDESNVIKGLKNIQSELTNTLKGHDEFVDGIIDGMRKARDLYKTAEDSVSKFNGKLSDALGNLGKGKASGNWIEDVTKHISKGTEESLEYAGSLAKVQKVMQTLTVASKVLKVALISTGIGALIVGLGTLIAHLGSVRNITDKVSIVFKGLGGLIQGITVQIFKFNDHLRTLGSIAAKVARGDVVGAFTEARVAITNFNKEIIESVRRTAELERQAQALRDANRELNVEYEQARTQIEKLRMVGEDQAKSEKERVKALKEASTLEASFLENRLENAKKELEIERGRKLDALKTQDDLDKEAALRIEISKIEKESVDLQTKLNNKLNTVLEEGRRKREAAAKALEEQRKAALRAIEDIQQALAKAEIEAIEQLDERLRAEAEAAKAAVVRQIEQAEAAAKAAGLEIDLSREKARLLELIEKDLNEKLKELYSQREEIAVAPIERLKTLTRDLSDYQVNIKPTLKEDDFGKVLDDIKLKIRGIFGKDNLISEKEFEFLAAQVTDIFNGAFELMNADLEARVEENEAKLDELRAKRKELEDQLKVEEEANEKGLASRVQRTKDALAQLNKDEEAALREQEELKKKNVRNQIIQNGLAQASNLITAGSKIFEAHSGIPFVGILLALAAVTSMLVGFKRIKQQARAETRGYKGGPLAELLGPARKSEDRHGVGDGYRLEGTNLIIGGDEMLVNARSYRRNKKHLDRINSGAFDNIDLSHIDLVPDLGGITESFRRRQALVDRRAEISAQALMKQAFTDAIERSSDKMVKAIRKKPVIIAVPPGSEIWEKSDGELLKYKA